MLIEREIRNVYFANGFDLGWRVPLTRTIVVDHDFGVELVHFTAVTLNATRKEKQNGMERRKKNNVTLRNDETFPFLLLKSAYVAMQKKIVYLSLVYLILYLI